MAEPADHQTRPATGDVSDTVQMSEIETKDHADTTTGGGVEADPAAVATAPEETVDTTMTTAATSQEKAAAATATEPSNEHENTGSEQPPVVPSKEETAAAADDGLSIEPTDSTAPVIASPEASNDHPVCNITLLLPTGARHPYKIDEKYLAKRNVTVPDVTEAGGMDPFSVSIYTLKELILREWRDEWDNKPASPSSIRLIHFGKLLEDKEQLKKYHFSRENPNVVHMSVRPAEMMEEDEAAKGKAASTRESRRSRREGTSESCCVIL